MPRELSAKVHATLLKMQRGEITEYHIYKKIASRIEKKDPHNHDVLERTANEERAHYEIWKGYTGEEPRPNRLKIFWYSFLSVVFGITFALKLMENGEDNANTVYTEIIAEVPEAQRISEDEQRHENELLSLLDEERLRYVGSMVLGLNDALVELTGTLAGLTFALQSNRLVALSGLITGISATLSMASSEFLSARSEGRKDAFKSCTYTGIAYLITVTLLVLPYLLLPAHAYALALGIMVATVVLIIFVFNFYISVAQGLNFKRRFLEMAGISLGVAALSFVVGLLVKHFLGIDV
ncbi:VIT1/CCC1 transporter family protein [Feifania hominis]|uniref:VIT1/CCC1 transporter family protein n=1 Tax=Feifania hominis TaxID=2763660 RepID=A0A926DB69_9FIRM|nr:VIT1/CCC1 transporter family protein [Feifania hominis]MBC8535298.1 VIT1/CCC1 transporter family protein [Feifania hominis]